MSNVCYRPYLVDNTVCVSVVRPAEMSPRTNELIVGVLSRMWAFVDEENRREFLATRRVSDPGEEASVELLVGAYLTSDYCALGDILDEEGRMIAIGAFGVVPVELGSYGLWAAVSSLARRHPLVAIRAARRALQLLQHAVGDVEIATFIPERFERAVRAARLCGFRRTPGCAANSAGVGAWRKHVLRVDR